MAGTSGNDIFYGGSGNEDEKFRAGDDLVYGGGGNDKLEGEEGDDGNDLLYGGDGADKIEGKDDDDTIYGGAGDDDIKGDYGSDLIYGGDGDDKIDAKKDNDTAYGGAGDDELESGNGGGVLYGGDDDDRIKGGDGDMFAYGGAGNDYLEGGKGNDRLDGGAGDDKIKTDDGADVVVFYDGAGNDTVKYFDEKEDKVEIGSKGIDTFADIQARMTGQGDDTLITLDDGSTILIDKQKPGDLTAANFIIVAPPVCFTPGTLISTPCGDRAVEILSEGDLVLTEDDGPQPIRWIGTREMTFHGAFHKHKPIRIVAGALGGHLPRRNMTVSPQHRLLIKGAVVRDMFDTDEVLALAKGLTGLPGIRKMMGKRSITYLTLLLDRHQILMAEGARTESFYPGPTALRMLPGHQAADICSMFPKLRTDPGTGYGPTARRVLTNRETLALADALKAKAHVYEMWDLDLANERDPAPSISLVNRRVA